MTTCERRDRKELIQQNSTCRIWDMMRAGDGVTTIGFFDPEEAERRKAIRRHRAWLDSIPHEGPSPYTSYRIGVYIRYFNQTKYDNYLDFHKQQFADTIALCPRWTLVDFYVDEGQTAPNMENARGWTRLLEDCFSGKVDLIVTQKTSNISRKPQDLTLISRILAAQSHPVGIYFISEDLFTLASYYRKDLKDQHFLPSPDWELLPEPEDGDGENPGEADKDADV